MTASNTIKKRLDYVEDIHGSNPDAAIIWLHGLGADGYDFKPIVQQLDLPDDLNIHFLFPHAPVQAVTLNQGMPMNAWYDIYQLSIDAQEDAAGIERSMHLLESLIDINFSHIDRKRILLAGFSQGGALALHTLLHGSSEYGGLIALSAYLPLRNLAPDARHQPRWPIFMAHGLVDEILPIYIAEMARDTLGGIGMQIDWHSYPMAHQLCPQEMQDIRRYIVTRLKD
jgi:phospholipase/carboxylesterase